MYKILNAMDFEDMEKYVERNFQVCKERLNTLLKKELNKEPIDISYKLSFDHIVRAKKSIVGDKREIEFSPKVTKRLEAFYTHALNERNESYYKSMSYDPSYDKEKAHEANGSDPRYVNALKYYDI